MVRRLSNWLYRVVNGWVALAGLVIFLLFTSLVLPQQASKTAQQLGTDESPDTSLFYTPSVLYRLAESYGVEGRQAYVRARFTFDVAWPLVYTFFLVTTLTWLFGRALPPSSPARLVNLAPLAAALFDFLENASTSWVMLRYPTQLPAVDWLAGVFTFLKWALIAVNFVLVLLGIALVAWKRLQARKP